MKKLLISCIGMTVLGSLIGCSQKEDMSNEILKKGIAIVEENGLLQNDDLNEISSLCKDLVSKGFPKDRTECTANLKSTGNDIFTFDTVDVAEIYFENNGASLLKWDIKKVDSDEAIISGELKGGEKTSRENYLLEEGNYKLSVNSDYDSEVDLYLEVNQLN